MTSTKKFIFFNVTFARMNNKALRKFKFIALDFWNKFYIYLPRFSIT